MSVTDGLFWARHYSSLVAQCGLTLPNLCLPTWDHFCLPVSFTFGRHPGDAEIFYDPILTYFPPNPSDQTLKHFPSQLLFFFLYFLGFCESPGFMHLLPRIREQSGSVFLVDQCVSRYVCIPEWFRNGRHWNAHWELQKEVDWWAGKPASRLHVFVFRSQSTRSKFCSERPALRKCFWSAGVKASSRRAVLSMFETALSRIASVRKWRKFVGFIFSFPSFYFFSSLQIPWMFRKAQRSWSLRRWRPDHRDTGEFCIQADIALPKNISGNPSPWADRKNHFRAVWFEWRSSYTRDGQTEGIVHSCKKWWLCSVVLNNMQRTGINWSYSAEMWT